MIILIGSQIGTVKTDHLIKKNAKYTSAGIHNQ